MSVGGKILFAVSCHARQGWLRYAPYCRPLALLLCLLVISRFASAALICSTPGKDGPGAPSGVVNTYYPATASVSAGATSISLGASSGAATAITSGDLLLVIQMQDADINTSNNSNYGSGSGTGAGYTALNQAGLYEFVKANNAVGTGGGTVTLAAGLVNNYRSRAATTSNGQSTFQVVRVPQYTTATVSGTLSAASWDGAKGGIVAIDVAGALTISGTVEADGKGFRGGWGESSATTGPDIDYRTLDTVLGNGTKGEGIAGSPTRMNASFNTNTPTLATSGTTANLGYPDGANTNATKGRGAPGNAGGGGTDGNTANDENAGGGGGGNYAAGGKGGNSWSSNLTVGGEGGAAVPVSNNRIVMGGGGGAGTTNNGTADFLNTYTNPAGNPVPSLAAHAAVAPPVAASSYFGHSPLPDQVPSTPAAAPAITWKTTPPAAAAPAVRSLWRPSSAALPRSTSAAATAATPGAYIAPTMPTGTAPVVAAAVASLPTRRQGSF